MTFRIPALLVSAGAGVLALALCLDPADVRAGEITPATGTSSLGTRVNGSTGSCTSGTCAVTQGTTAGRNLFHRFAAFDARNGITGVTIDSRGKNNVIVGVTNPAGTFINRSLTFLNGRPNVFWLSPGGISLGGGGGFVNTANLSLSTATGLRFSRGVFDVASTCACDLAFLADDPVPGRAGLVTDPATLAGLGLSRNGDITLAGGLLTVDSSLLVDAQEGNLLLQGANGVAFATSGGSGVAAGASVTNTGSLSLEGGSLRIEGGGTDTGTYAVGQGAGVEFAAGRRTLAPGSDVAGAGAMTVSGGSVIVDGNLGIARTGTVRVTGGELLLNNSVTFDNAFTLGGEGSTLGGSGNLTFNGPLNWTGGSQIGSGGSLVTNGTTTIAGASSQSLFREWTNNGTIRFADGASLDIRAPLLWTNGVRGVIDLDGASATPILVSAGSATLTNLGRIDKDSDTRQALATNLTLVNRGLLDLNAGELGINGFLTQKGTVSLSGGATLFVGQGGFTNEGTLRGTGTVVVGQGPFERGVLVNAGIIGPGGDDSIGTLAVEGDYRQTSQGRLLLDVGGTQRGSSDLLEVSGTATLGGSLEVDLVNGYTPRVGDSTEVIQALGGINGRFNREVLPEDLVAVTVRDGTTQSIQLLRECPPGGCSPPPPEEPFLLPFLNDLEIFLLGADRGEEGLGSAQAKLEMEDASFSTPGGRPAPGALPPAGPPTVLSLQQVREAFLRGESQAVRDTAARLGLGSTTTGQSLSPEGVQGLLNQVTEWMRSLEAAPACVEGGEGGAPCR